jgi:dienelactone hydrolase
MLVHGGAGLDDHARQQARRYAELGYVVLACDMFGRDIAGGPRQQIIALLTEMRDDPDRLVRRARAALDLLSRVRAIDERMAVVGFCFGGLAALQLARSGAPIAAAVSIHGSLAASVHAEPGQVRARLLVCHGALDPHVPVADVIAFAEEMNAAGAYWQLNSPARSLASPTTSRPTPSRSPLPATSSPARSARPDRPLSRPVGIFSHAVRGVP